MRLMKLLLALTAVCFLAAAEDYTYWSSGEVTTKEKQLAGKATPQASASEQLAKYGNHLIMVAHRKGDGEVEIHDNMTDYFFAKTGEATLVVGGKVTGGKSAGPGELRGGTIEGGQRQRLRPGDIAHIPAGMPHQLLIAKGGKFTYVVIKVQRP
jgi:mannose-6-phosphate isomerase-like protein (cupin superfamily)